MRIYLKSKCWQVLNGSLPTTTPVGYRYNDEDDSFSAFVGTERQTGAVKYDATKDQLLLVLKRSDRTKGAPVYVYAKPQTLSAVTRGELPTSTPVGFRYNGQNESFTAFVATDRESGAIKWAGKDGEEAIALNFRKSKKVEKTPAPAQAGPPAIPGDDLPF